MSRWPTSWQERAATPLWDKLQELSVRRAQKNEGNQDNFTLETGPGWPSLAWADGSEKKVRWVNQVPEKKESGLKYWRNSSLWPLTRHLMEAGSVDFWWENGKDSKVGLEDSEANDSIQRGMLKPWVFTRCWRELYCSWKVMTPFRGILKPWVLTWCWLELYCSWKVTSP